MHTHAEKQTVALSKTKDSGSSNFQFADQRPETTALSRIQALANASPQVAHARAIQAKADTRPVVATTRYSAIQMGPHQRVTDEEEPPQGKFAMVQHAEANDEEVQMKAAGTPEAAIQHQTEAPSRPNNTGLPDNLKAGIESLSGISMDNVKVHYNSDKPAQLNAYAYAQGTDIHIAPGQERHLPHESWHVVQQAQGRVSPTAQAKEAAINDDMCLEAEADVMGGMAERLGMVTIQHPGTEAPLQRVRSQSSASPRGIGNVFQLSRKGYLEQFRKGYRDGFREGLNDGLTELVGENIVTRVAAGNIYELYLDDSQIEVESIKNYLKDYDVNASNKEHRSAGYRIGSGAGFDRGYEVALSQYGYSRKYSAIPGANVAIAQQDNGGMCVYCNTHQIEDIDHIESLKNHWASRGSTMDQHGRSTEANDTLNLVGACASCNRSKGSKKLAPGGWWPQAWQPGQWWPFGPARVQGYNKQPPYAW